MKIAKSRDWTEAEVGEAVASIKREPGLWDELRRIEQTTGDFDNDVGLRADRIVARMHPECELHEITQLLIAVRLVRRAELGL
ncbi:MULTISPECIES: hypothetical protein [unclassified Bradyrhizobium]|uniref:hypothetical protein n=1 Tax=unclassified Bradyrhizobium TaxID=2631580 RepID=UPI0028E811DD|nr:MULTISPECIES: hypothetical protein [unclassified Bradyrhizobium]